MSDVIVSTTLGPVRTSLGGGAIAFRGIRYGGPPVGESRFRPPAWPEPWSTPADCTEPGPVAPQVPSPLDRSGRTPPPQSEDCLFLNVFTPACDGARRPVMLWLHGGGFVSGAGSTEAYDGTSFADHHDVVIVTVNYRLGALGFAHLPDLGPGFETSGNNGILDQVQALRWVQGNIEAFGGDPDNVTIFGESAGAMSVAVLLAMPAAAGLFHKAIAQSGAAASVRSVEDATAATDALLNAVGCDAADLRSVAVERLLEAQQKLTGGLGLRSFGPVVDGLAVPEHPLEAIAAGSASGVPLLIGTNADEARLFALGDPTLDSVDRAGLRDRLQSIATGDELERIVTGYEDTRPDATAADLWSAVFSDRFFRAPAVRLAELQLRHAPTYVYLFTWRTSALGGRLGACHGLEIPFVFDSLGTGGGGMFFETVTPANRDLARRVNASWASFARTGEPNHDAAPVWSPYDLVDRPTMLIDDEWQLAHDPAGDELRLWR